MSRRTPEGGGSTEHSPSSTRSFSSNSPPRVADASPSQLDPAALAEIVESALPAAMVGLRQLTDMHIPTLFFIVTQCYDASSFALARLYDRTSSAIVTRNVTMNGS